MSTLNKYCLLQYYKCTHYDVHDIELFSTALVDYRDCECTRHVPEPYAFLVRVVVLILLA